MTLVRTTQNIGIYIAERFEQIDDFIPLGSQKTPTVPFKVKVQISGGLLTDY